MIIKVIPNLISTSELIPLSNHCIIGYVGVYNYKPNEEAALFLIKLAKDNNYPLILIGKNPTKNMINRAKQYSNIVITGEVKSVKQTLIDYKVRLMVIPIFSGSGTRFKVLEAMNYGIPIVATNKAVEGLGLIHGHDFMCSSSKLGFELNINYILQSNAMRNYLRRNARARFLRCYSFDSWRKYYET